MSSRTRSQTITKQLRNARAANLMSDRYRSDILAAVLQITGQIAGILDLEPLLDQIVQQTKALFSCSEAVSARRPATQLIRPITVADRRVRCSIFKNSLVN